MSLQLQSDGSPRARVLAALSYMGILCFVPLLTNRDDEYVHFHARQGLVLWMWEVIAMFALFLPGIGKFFFSLSAFVILLFSIVGLISTAFQKAWRLPLVSRVAEFIG